MNLLRRAFHARRGIALWRKMKDLSRGNSTLEAMLHRQFLLVWGDICVVQDACPDEMREFVTAYGCATERSSPQAAELCLRGDVSRCDIDTVRSLVQEAGHGDILNEATVEILHAANPYIGSQRTHALHQRLRAQERE